MSIYNLHSKQYYLKQTHRALFPLFKFTYYDKYMLYTMHRKVILYVYTLSMQDVFLYTIHVYIYNMHKHEGLSLQVKCYSSCCRGKSRSGQLDNVSTMYLAYDNMCNLCRMKVAREPLPLPAPLDTAWLSLNKIIDSFHLRNHVNLQCHQLYSPEGLKLTHPHVNTQAGEQTFVWLGRFKHILCAMTKTHHLFYLHRMVRRRNEYTVKCYLNGRKPILPKSKL